MIEKRSRRRRSRTIDRENERERESENENERVRERERETDDIVRIHCRITRMCRRRSSRRLDNYVVFLAFYFRTIRTVFVHVAFTFIVVRSHAHEHVRLCTHAIKERMGGPRDFRPTMFGVETRAHADLSSSNASRNSPRCSPLFDPDSIPTKQQVDDYETQVPV